MREDEVDNSWVQSLEYTHFNKGSIVSYPDDFDPMNASPAIKSSFGFGGFAKVGDYHYVKLYGGYVKYQRRFSVALADDETLVVSGTVSEPTRICVQVDKTTNACTYYAENAEPSDSGSYWYKVLHEVYLNDAGLPIYAKDRRTDWTLGSPIG